VGEYLNVGIADLLLDGRNPRHATVSGQREIIAALLRDGASKLVRLARDIASYGLNPVEVALVMRTAKDRYTVLEGNRRTAVLKLLTNPDLAAGHTVEAEFRRLSGTAALPADILCTVVASREEARHWLELRHTGERQGAGVVPWSAEQTQRFKGERGSQAERGLAFAEAVRSSFPDNKKLQEDLDEVRRERLTTLGRLVSDPNVRKALGLTFEKGRLLTHYSVAELERAFERLVRDLAASVTVSDLKTKEQRQVYLSTLGSVLPTAAAYQSSPQPFTRAARTQQKRKQPPERPPPAPPTHLFDGVVLTKLSQRVAAILRELQQLDVGRFPNASAVLTRVVLELAVVDVFEQAGWPPASFREGVKRCLIAIDPGQTSPEYQAVRMGLQDGTSLFAVKTMHGFVHNQHYHPAPMEVRSIAANWTAFLAALDSFV
jgi:hypothetical protein